MMAFRSVSGDRNKFGANMVASDSISIYFKTRGRGRGRMRSFQSPNQLTPPPTNTITHLG